MTAWWTGIAAAATTIECGGHSHTLRWDQGVLAAIDHDDPEGEATLAALAGETAPCLERLRAWSRRRDDVRVLTLGSRGLTDQLRAASDRHPHPRAPVRRRSETELLELLALGGGLPERLQAHAAAVWARRLHTGHASLDAAMPQLQAALYGRSLAALRVWLGQPELAIELTMVAADGERRLERCDDAVAVTLPFAWLSEVWARGLTTIFGRFCVAADSADGIHWQLETVGPDLGAGTRLAITIEQR